MLVSKSQGRYLTIDGTKVSQGRFFTTGDWLRPQIDDFIRGSALVSVFDPFAGEGHLLRALEKRGYRTEGCDIDPRFGWPLNDSLIDIPTRPDSLIVTNPPYLAKHSAKRKGVRDRVEDYYRAGGRYDLYEVALDRCLSGHGHVIALIPETFLNGDYPKARLRTVTILENDLFEDTDCPSCVACFGPTPVDAREVLIYRNDEPLLSLASLEATRRIPRGDAGIRFNVPEGRVGLRAVDMPDPYKPIAFLHHADLDYDPTRIKVSSRLVTFLELHDVPDDRLSQVIRVANEELAMLRKRSFDLVLSPFKGNIKSGRRRRRLDYATARSLLETAIRVSMPKPEAGSTVCMRWIPG